MYRKFSLYEIFVLKLFRSVIIPRKYFNTKILQHSICNSIIGFARQVHTRRGELEQGEETYGETAMEEFSKRNGCILGYHAYKEVWEAAVGQ